MNEALIPIFEATDRSILPVMMMKTIGSIIKPISIKSEEVRERLRASRKKGERRVLIMIVRRINPTSIHSQRWNLWRNERCGGNSLISVEDFDSEIVCAFIISSSPHDLRSTCQKSLQSKSTSLVLPIAKMVRCESTSTNFG